MSETEAIETFRCFGSTCTVLVSGEGPAGSARDAVLATRAQLLEWHERFSRFLPASELSGLNREPADCIPVSPLMGRLAQAVHDAGVLTGGLVDGTLLKQVQDAGYESDLGEPLDLDRALALAPPRRPAGPSPRHRWEQVQMDLVSGMLTRPPGLMLDSGGLAKGLFADALAETLAAYESFAVNCAGDLTIGGSGKLERAIEVQSPFDGGTIHTFHGPRGSVATSGIGRRSWLDVGGAAAHHLLDPSTGRPAFTGIVQVTALAPNALTAEIHAKAALLSGPGRARAWLPHGGVIVYDDGAHEAIVPPPVITLRRSSDFETGLRRQRFSSARRRRDRTRH